MSCFSSLLRLMLLMLICLGSSLFGQLKHSSSSRYPAFEGRVMCGYQGWFRVPADGAGRKYQHWGEHRQFGEDSYVTIDIWPDVSEYEITYPSGFYFENGEEARIFSSYDYSTVDTHFRWMQEYGVDGVFVQRFYDDAKGRFNETEPNKVLKNALAASLKYDRALAVMYDLTGIRPGLDDCDTLIEDWKKLVDELKITSQGNHQSYLYDEGKPVVAIWGIGFPDRDYDIRDIKILEFIDFLQNDPEYGGCSVMLGVPCYFRELKIDSTKDPFLHEIIQAADIVLPWGVKRFNSILQKESQRFFHHVLEDLKWCEERNLKYVPLVYPGMSWVNLSTVEGRPHQPLNGIPRLRGHHYWMMIDSAINAGAQMLYIAMFDEVDEGTAIFKCRNTGPVSERWQFLNMEDVPNDYYLWLTGQAGEFLREGIEINAE